MLSMVRMFACGTNGQTISTNGCRNRSVRSEGYNAEEHIKCVFDDNLKIIHKAFIVGDHYNRLGEASTT